MKKWILFLVIVAIGLTVLEGAFAQSLDGLLARESFEGVDFPPEGWTKQTAFGGSGWSSAAVDSSLAGLIGFGTVDTPPGGGQHVAFASWVTGDADGNNQTDQPLEQWLITPQITDIQPGDSLKFAMRFFSVFDDKLDIRVSRTDADSIASFDTTLLAITFTGNPTNEWQHFSIDLSGFSGEDIFIGFREHVASVVNQGDAVLLDLVEITSLVTSVAQDPRVPNAFSLEQNFPNPFNPTTNIRFTLGQTSQVTLTVYNLIGQSVATLFDHQILAAGSQTVRFNAANLSNGVYYYRLEADTFVDVKRMTLVK